MGLWRAFRSWNGVLIDAERVAGLSEESWLILMKEKHFRKHPKLFESRDIHVNNHQSSSKLFFMETSQESHTPHDAFPSSCPHPCLPLCPLLHPSHQRTSPLEAVSLGASLPGHLWKCFMQYECTSQGLLKTDTMTLESINLFCQYLS